MHKEDIERLGISDGDLVTVEIVRIAKADTVDLNGMPTFVDDNPRASVEHDRYLYG